MDNSSNSSIIVKEGTDFEVIISNGEIKQSMINHIILPLVEFSLLRVKVTIKLMEGLLHSQ